MIENIGSACLGAIVGYVVMYFVARLASDTPKVAVPLGCVVLGGVVVAIIGKLSTSKRC